MIKTNAIRILEANSIEFTTAEYEFSPEEIDAVSVAKMIDADPERVFKTLVARGDKTGINVFVIPGNYTLDLKKAANSSQNKKTEMIKEKELFPLTGYIKGGCTPIGMKKNFPVYIDESAQLWDKIYISAGMRGMQVLLNPQDLRELAEAEFADLIQY
jgi:Cys-tRNA(Pro)/Cys-tRNA(Cys) deacylase